MINPTRTSAPPPIGKAPPLGDPGSYALSEADFDRVADRIHALAGIVLERHKMQMIQTRLGRRVRTLGLPSIKQYLNLLDSPGAGTEVQSFIDTLTTNLTSFFRERHHFDHLSRCLFGSSDPDHQVIKIWSAGCSSGEEPYSIAMTALSRPEDRQHDVQILATDLDSGVLVQAKAGVYPSAKCEVLDTPELRRFTVPSPDSGSVALSEDLKALITFRQLNLMERWPMTGPFDAIFCRNVVIYFSSETKRRLLDRFSALLRPGGFLYLGHSEAILGEHRYFQSCGDTIYQRKAG